MWTSTSAWICPSTPAYFKRKTLQVSNIYFSNDTFNFSLKVYTVSRRFPEITGNKKYVCNKMIANRNLPEHTMRHSDTSKWRCNCKPAHLHIWRVSFQQFAEERTSCRKAARNATMSVWCQLGRYINFNCPGMGCRLWLWKTCCLKCDTQWGYCESQSK